MKKGMELKPCLNSVCREYAKSPEYPMNCRYFYHFWRVFSVNVMMDCSYYMPELNYRPAQLASVKSEIPELCQDLIGTYASTSRPAQPSPIDTLKCVEMITDCPKCNHQFTVKAFCYADCKAPAQPAMGFEELADYIMEYLSKETGTLAHCLSDRRSEIKTSILNIIRANAALASGAEREEKFKKRLPDAGSIMARQREY